jgi:hypothetical protein
MTKAMANKKQMGDSGPAMNPEKTKILIVKAMAIRIVLSVAPILFLILKNLEYPIINYPLLKLPHITVYEVVNLLSKNYYNKAGKSYIILTF